MTPELMFIVMIVLSLGTVLLFARLGKDWLIAVPAILLVLSNVFAPQLIKAFGLTTSLAVPMYAAIFLATDIIAEHYGVKEARKVVWIGLASQVMLLVVSQMMIRTQVLPFSQSMHDALITVFSFTPRLVLASLVAYVISQFHDVWAFHAWKRRTKGKHLWIRNNASTIVSQFIDTVIVVVIAFYGVLPGLIELILGIWILKVIIALLDTPFMYLSGMVIKRA
ncbi:MAG: queuosine precursor transporter [Candidatus Woesearchaeota archaeon]